MSDFEISKIYCNNSAINEYNRLKTVYLNSSKLYTTFNTNLNDKENSKQNHKSININFQIKLANELKKKYIHKNKKQHIINKLILLQNKKLCEKKNYIKSENDNILQYLFSNQQNVVNNNYFLKINNDFNGCYANVSIQALLLCSNLFEMVI